MVGTRWRCCHSIADDLHGCSSNVHFIYSRNNRFVLAVFKVCHIVVVGQRGYKCFLVIWLYQNVLGSYLEPYLGPIIDPVVKSVCSKLDPYIGQYVPGISSYASTPDSSSCCSGSTCSETVPKAAEQPSDTNVTKRRVKKAD